MFEDTAIQFLTKGGTFRVQSVSNSAPFWLHLPALAALTLLKDTSKGQHARFIEAVKELKPSSSHRRMLVVPSSRNQPSVDFADASDRVYQATISLLKQPSFADLKEYLPADSDRALNVYCVSPDFDVEFKLEDVVMNDRDLERIKLHVLHLPARLAGGGKASSSGLVIYMLCHCGSCNAATL